jgi:hypothetical protein
MPLIFWANILLFILITLKELFNSTQGNAWGLYQKKNCPKKAA